jgi:hypothetical protein
MGEQTLLRVPYRITLNCTADGYAWTVYDKDGKELGSYDMARTPRGFQGSKKAARFYVDMKPYSTILEPLGEGIFLGMHLSDALKEYVESSDTEPLFSEEEVHFDDEDFRVDKDAGDDS